MRKILLFAFLFSVTGIHAQSISMEAISSTGANYSNAAASLSFTEGELEAGPVTGGSLVLCRGFQQNYITYWVGNTDTNWNNASNWNGGPVPDLHTDLVILPSRPQYPAINANVSCRSVQVLPGASITIQPGFTLTVTH